MIAISFSDKNVGELPLYTKSRIVGTKVFPVPVPVPLSVPGLFGSKFPVLYGSSVLYGS